jgi:fumarate hydratase class I
MLKLRDGIVELYKKVATSIPTDVEDALKKTYLEETEPLAKQSLHIILKNISVARTTSRPVCQDTGFPVFYIKIPKGLSYQHIRDVIVDATRIATNKIPLRPNSVDVITEKNTGDNVGTYFPLIYIEETEDQTLTVDLMLKGGGCENLGQTYKLPMAIDYENVISPCPPLVKNSSILPLVKGGRGGFLAERDFEGIRKCILDAVYKAQGRGCPPYTLGVAIGGAKDQVTVLSKKQLMRRLYDKHPNEMISNLETLALNDLNTLGIGTAGLGGKTTAIGVKIAAAHRHPASYFVDISFSCWANRRGRLIW